MKIPEKGIERPPINKNTAEFAYGASLHEKTPDKPGFYYQDK